MTGKDLAISHFSDTDTLVIHTEGVLTEGETVAPDLSVHYNWDGEVMSVVIEHAAKTLGPYLFPGDGRECKRNGVSRELKILYSPETDILQLQTGEPPYVRKPVDPGLWVNFDAEGWAMSVVLEGAAELLRPYLLAESTGVV